MRVPQVWVGFVPASKMRLRRGLGYPTQITVPYVFTACNPTLKIRKKWDFCEAVILCRSRLQFVIGTPSVPLNCKDESLIKMKWDRKCDCNRNGWKWESTISVERLFSVGGNILDDKRKKLKAKSVSRLMFSREAMRALKYNYWAFYPFYLFYLAVSQIS